MLNNDDGQDKTSELFIMLLTLVFVYETVMLFVPGYSSSKRGFSMKYVFSDFQVDDIVTYTLISSDMPKQPGKNWFGKVVTVYQDTNTLDLELLNVGFEGLRETVSFMQVVEVEHT